MPRGARGDSRTRVDRVLRHRERHQRAHEPSDGIQLGWAEHAVRGRKLARLQPLFESRPLWH